ncbi:Sodium/hydrogen exchanger family protein [Parafrankia irregularis]|uniref:Sodium/hydrogen exchanger family protein n=1 Tax=Parafrankia irregularis TaxID=795642 RepID=A0A0S4QF11_9ACTN|nr:MULTISPECIES: cation:proton antiporter [Parafrankia]MBE3199575.1 cation:proton antiporter [Parafrankia sp. CH37]CUU53759.1 Sodium/hydrogen exchanger family protein [Parafrankia irregularis]
MNVAEAFVATAPLSHHSLLIFLLQLTVLLALALALGKLAVRIGLPSVVGELLAGVLLGPSLLGDIAPDFSGWLLPTAPDQMHLLDAVGQMGVILLVGLTGLEMDMRMVRRRGATAARISAAGLLLPVGLGIGAGLLLPGSLLGEDADRHVFALFLGVAMGVSAIPVAAKILLDMRLLHRNVGQLILASATVDDAVGWSLLSVVSAMATTGVRGGDIAWPVISLLSVVLVAVLLGRPLARIAIAAGGLAREETGSGAGPGPAAADVPDRVDPAAGPSAAAPPAASTSAEHGTASASAAGPPAVPRIPIPAGSGGTASGIAVVVLFIFAAAAGTHALKLEAILGAFVAGILLGSAPNLDSRRLEPLRLVVMGVLAPIFFASAGLRIDLTALAEAKVALAAVVILSLAVIGKFAGAYLGARISRLGHWEALSLGAGLNARGVIEIVVAGTGLRLGVLSTAMYTVIVLVAIVTSIMTPPILRATMRRVEQTAQERLRELDLVGQPAGLR